MCKAGGNIPTVDAALLLYDKARAPRHVDITLLTSRSHCLLHMSYAVNILHQASGRCYLCDSAGFLLKSALGSLGLNCSLEVN